jgi:hypothetical protein
MLRLLKAAFVMVSALSAAVAVRDTRAAREEERSDRWRQESERRLDALADAIVAVGEAAIMFRGKQGQGPNLDAAQLRLRRAVTVTLNPWIEIQVIADLAGGEASLLTTEAVEKALENVANAVERVREEAGKTHRQRKREVKHQLALR